MLSEGLVSKTEKQHVFLENCGKTHSSALKGCNVIKVIIAQWDLRGVKR